MRKNIFYTLILLVLVTELCALAFVAEPTHAAQRTIVLAASNWEPYFGENLPEQGFYTELSRVAFQRVGYKLKVEFVPWKRALEVAKAGGYDGLMGSYYTEERTQYFTYSDPVYEDEIVFFCRKGEVNTYTTLQDLAPYTIGVLRGTAVLEELWKEPSLKIEEVTSEDLNVRKLMGKRIELILSSKLAISNLLNTQFPQWKDAIEVVSPSFQIIEGYNTISKKIADHESIIADFNRGLQMIKEDGTFQDILRKHGF